jgi:hypothetical protein
MAAFLAVGIGSFALGFIVILNAVGLFAVPALYGPAGGVTGRTTLAVVIWLIAWVVLHSRWKDQQIGFETFSIRHSWNCAARSLHVLASIEQRHELPDDVTRKDGHGDIPIPPRPAASGNSADDYCRQQQKGANREDGEEKPEEENACRPEHCQKAWRQYRGNHRQAPSRHPQPAGAGQRQPYNTQDNQVRRDATQLRAHAHPRPQSQDEREQQNTRHNKPSNVRQTRMNFREAKHQAQRPRDSQQKWPAGKPNISGCTRNASKTFSII